MAAFIDDRAALRGSIGQGSYGVRALGSGFACSGLWLRVSLRLSMFACRTVGVHRSTIQDHAEKGFAARGL